MHFKGAWTIMINGFVRGGSCVSWELIETMLTWVNSKGKGYFFLRKNGVFQVDMLHCKDNAEI